MLSRMHTGTLGTCGARTLLGEAYRATPLGCGLGSHPPTLDLPRRAAADHILPKVPLNDGLSDVLKAVRTVTTFSLKARVYLSVYYYRKGRCVVAGCRKLSAEQTGYKHTRGVCTDARPHAYRDFWRMWRPDSAGCGVPHNPLGWRTRLSPTYARPPTAYSSR